ncbi:MAG: glycosyltransferase family 1 protein [Actinomycetota bacterium]
MPDPESETPLRVAYTLEQLWHTVPGGTAVAALRVAEILDRDPSVDLHFVAGRHPLPPAEPYRPDRPVHMLPLARPLLYEAWIRLRWPRVEAVTGPIDVAHATGLVPCATSAPLVVTLHDLAFVHEPEKFTRHGVRLMTRSLDAIGRRATAVLCSSRATVDDAIEWGLPADRLRHVPLGVDVVPADGVAVERVRRRFELPDEFVLFVGTIEPRKNLVRLARAVALDGDLPLVVAGATGWGDVVDGLDRGSDVRFLGFVSDEELRGLYAAATVFAYPSEREGFGLPVLEAMAQSTPVVTSASTSTAEVAGGAAVLVEPTDVGDIARGVREAAERRDELAAAGRRRAAEMTWRATAERTAEVYREVAA